MHIVLYFGSFNPIHTGHLIIASSVADRAEVDGLWFVVSPQNPFKKLDELWNEKVRLDLVQQAIQGDARLSCCDIEFTLPRPSYTIDTLHVLAQLYPTCKFSILIGSDNLPSLHSWKSYEELVANHHIYVYPRPGFPLAEDNKLQVNLVDVPQIDLSATDIRRLIEEKKSIKYMVPEVVENYISKGLF